MSGKVIGQNLDYGYPGSVSRASDTVIMTFPVADGVIKFGDPVEYDPETNTVKPVSKSVEASNIIGFAVREVRQPYADDTSGWFYKKGDACNVLVRGSMVVAVLGTTGITGRSKVYVCNGNSEDHPAGGIMGEAGSSSDTVELTNAIFSTGRVDANNVAEITLLERLV